MEFNIEAYINFKFNRNKIIKRMTTFISSKVPQNHKKIYIWQMKAEKNKQQEKQKIIN